MGRLVAAITEKYAAENTTCDTPTPCTAPPGMCTTMDTASKVRGPSPDRMAPAAVRPPIDAPSLGGRQEVSNWVLSRKTAAEEGERVKRSRGSKHTKKSIIALQERQTKSLARSLFVADKGGNFL